MRAKKSLGQHWLKSESALRALVAAAELGRGEIVLEIGPGEGILTAALLITGAQVVAVEKDDRLIETLQKKFAAEISAGQLNLIHDDILNFNCCLIPENYKLVANIPYYLTGQILRKFLTATNQPQLMVLTLQKEVAKRILARAGKESLLSISVKAFGEPKYLKTIPAGAFAPAPAVDSAILLIKNISRANFQNLTEERFFEILHRGFAHKRKMLASNLNCSSEILARCTIEKRARAENVSLKQWFCLIKKLK